MFTSIHTHIQASPGKPRHWPWHWCPSQTCCPIIALEGKQSLRGRRSHASSTGPHHYEEVFYRRMRFHGEQPSLSLSKQHHHLSLGWPLCQPHTPVSHCYRSGSALLLLGWYCFIGWRRRKKKRRKNPDQWFRFNLRLLEVFHSQITCCCQQCFPPPVICFDCCLSRPTAHSPESPARKNSVGFHLHLGITFQWMWTPEIYGKWKNKPVSKVELHCLFSLHL